MSKPTEEEIKGTIDHLKAECEAMVRELSKRHNEELSLRAQNKILAREILNGGGGSIQNLESIGVKGGADSNATGSRRGAYKRKGKDTNTPSKVRALNEGKEATVQSKKKKLDHSSQQPVNDQIVKGE